MKPSLKLACAAVLLLPAALSARAGGSAGTTGTDDPAAVARMSVAEFKQAFDKQQVISVDVRGIDAYRAGHIPGALLLPGGSEVTDKAAGLTKAGKTVVTYCS